MSTGDEYLQEVRKSLRGHKRLAEGALAQISEQEFFAQLDPEANSIALIVKHMAGNMRSRWTDFLTTDGEKPERKRDTEFEFQSASDTRLELMRRWEEGWKLALDTVTSLTPEDLQKTVYIRGEEHSVLQAVNRQVAHYAYHVGQIVLLAKHVRGAGWKSLSIPKGQSETYGAQAEKDRRKQQE